MDSIWQVVSELGNNKIFIGFAMILMNMGSRYIIGDIGQLQNKILASPFIKKIILFCMFFIPTRDVSVAGLLTLLFSIVQVVLHEKSPFNLLPESVISSLSVNPNPNYQHGMPMPMPMPMSMPAVQHIAQETGVMVIQEESRTDNKIETYMNQVQRLNVRSSIKKISLIK